MPSLQILGVSSSAVVHIFLQVGAVPSWVDVDAASPILRRESLAVLQQHLELSSHLGLSGRVTELSDAVDSSTCSRCLVTLMWQYKCVNECRRYADFFRKARMIIDHSLYHP